MRVGEFELDRDVMFLEDSPEFFQNFRKIRDRNAVTFISILFFLGVSFTGGFGECPVWVATCSQCCSEVFLFLLCRLCCGGYFFGPMLYCFDYPPACVQVGGVTQNGGTDQCVLVSCKPQC